MVVVFDMSSGDSNWDDVEEPGIENASLDAGIRLRSDNRVARRLELQSALPSDLHYDVDSLISTVGHDGWD
jgi:hypothetical protein